MTSSDNINNYLTAFESYLDNQFPETQFSSNIHSRDNENDLKILKSKSVGCDNIPTNIHETNVMTLAIILSNVINKSLSQGIFAQSLKRAKMLPLFKK